MLYLLHRILGKRRDVEIIAGVVDEGIEEYRAPSVDCAQSICDDLNIRLERVSYPDLSFPMMDDLVASLPQVGESNDEVNGMMPCSFCGVFRRQGLNALAERVGADVMALGHNLDDVAQSILMNLQKGEVDRTIRLAPHTKQKIDGLTPRIVLYVGFLNKRYMLLQFNLNYLFIMEIVLMQVEHFDRGVV